MKTLYLANLSHKDDGITWHSKSVYVAAETIRAAIFLIEQKYQGVMVRSIERVEGELLGV